MACQVQAPWLRSGLSILENDVIDNSCLSFMVCVFHKRSHDPSRRASQTGIKFIPRHTRRDWKISLALDPGAVSGDDRQEISDGRTGLGSTRLGRIAIASGKQLFEKFNSARKNFPTKIFLLLLGFYTANALATILGQTGDWDVLVAGVVVAAIEGIGMLMYKKSSMSTGRFKSLVVMINYWKAGVCLGLFVDAFKLGS